jgi:hypothetical protein
MLKKMVSLTVLLSVSVSAESPSPPFLVPFESSNLKIVKSQPGVLDTTPLVKGAAHNWFAATLGGLPVQSELTLRVLMKGNDTANKADVSKWQGLWPVMTYADPTDYDSYNWFTKKEGQWVSGDSLLKSSKRLAGSGVTPIQSVIPAAQASQFLSADGTFWSAWRTLPTATADSKGNTFELRHSFERPQATIAMRVPYSYGYQQQFLQRLQAAKRPGVYVDQVGLTPQNRKLQIVRLEDDGLPANVATSGASNPAASTVALASSALSPQQLKQQKDEAHKTILVIAREHATEHASSWAVHGLLLELLADTPHAKRLRADTTWMLVLIQDPDAAAASRFEGMTERFRNAHSPDTPPEVFDYARYFVDYADRGRTLDMVVSIHNVEASEASNVFSPYVHTIYKEDTLAFNQALFKRLQGLGYATGKAKSSRVGATPFRLYGWCSQKFGSFDLAYEVNDQYPRNRLSFAHLQGVGMILGRQIGSWCRSYAGRRHHLALRELLAQREKERAAYLSKNGVASTERARYDLLIRGY